MNSQKMMSTGTYTSHYGSYTQQSGVYQHVTIGAVTEVYPQEYRVAMTPSLVREFILNGHTVFVQSGAGVRAGFQDEMYLQAGATILTSAAEVYQKSSILMKVLQPQPEEYGFIQPQQIIFCFLFGENQTPFFQTMTERKAIIFSYQGIESMNTFPVFNALTEVTGFLGVQQAMTLMETQMGGNGMLFGQVSGVEGAHVLILGAGVCGLRAAQLAAGTGAYVTLMDNCPEALRRATEFLPTNVRTVQYSSQTLEQFLPTTDVLIGGVLPTGFKAPILVTEEQMKLMRPNTIAIDLAIDMGGNFQVSQPQPLQKPTFQWNNITIFCGSFITNLAPRAISLAISNATTPFVLQVANNGWKRAVLQSVGLQQGLCLVEQRMTSQQWATTTKMTYTPFEQVLATEIQQLPTTSTQQETNLWSLKQQLSTFRTEQGSQYSGFFTIEA